MCALMCAQRFPTNNKPEAGFSLIELVVFIVVVGVAVVGVLGAIDFAARTSPDPIVEKQSLAIAESLLQEVESMPFTYCDPDDPAVSTATSTADCATPEAMGPEAGETRYSTTSPFDNVNDYNGFAMTGIRDINNNLISGLDGYSATVTITQAAFGVVPAAEGLLISVTVTGPGTISTTIAGYRARYAPTAGS